jgi:hypothetical protein
MLRRLVVSQPIFIFDQEPQTMSDLSRREFVARSMIAAAVMQLPAVAGGQQAPANPPAGGAAAGTSGKEAALRWLDGAVPPHTPGVTWGVPWPMGTYPKNQTFALKTDKGEDVALQTWPTAYWPDGTLKWTAHAVPADAGLAENLTLAPGTPAAPSKPLSVKDSADAIDIDTGVIVARLPKKGNALIESIQRDGKPILQSGQLVLLRRDKLSEEDAGPVQTEKFLGNIESVKIEQNGPVRAVVRFDGKHQADGSGRAWLPFSIRLYFYGGSDAVRIMHTFVFDGDEFKDFVNGIGVSFNVPMHDEMHNRHVRLVGEAAGLLAEGVRGLTGLRRAPGAAVMNSQLYGWATPPASTFPDTVKNRLQYIPAWGDYTLTQLSSEGFEIRKRTKAGYGWIKIDEGQRAGGSGYVGSPSGGVAFGLRDFWQKYPAQIDIRNAHTDTATVTMWLYAPEARPMDLRFYHDDMGMTNHQQELEGLEITYEDYEKGFGTPYGIARTSEIYLWALPATPSREAMIQMADVVRMPPLLTTTPQQFKAANVFGGLFTLPDKSNPVKAAIENQLDFLFDFYKGQVEQRHWYGFWDYGDVMHTYDADRHVWRYDVGGFAWDNSELSPDLWLWYSFLRSGRSDIFRFAEAMTRHTGEVDTYHIGRFAMLGSRHNVQHWGCSAKQLRISTPVYRRYYYYLTADERVGDLMNELLEADKTFVTLDPIRKIRQGAYTPDPHALSVGFGTDWGSLAVIWLTAWERTGDTKWRDKVINGMKTIAAEPKGFFTGSALFDPETGKFQLSQETRASASHLSAVFGQVEVNAELIAMLDEPEFKKAWLQYCELYNAGAAAQQAALGNSLGNLNLGEAHSRLTAYAAAQKNDPALAQRAWNEFFGGAAGYGVRTDFQVRKIEGPLVLNPVDEAAWVSTNATAQWGLAAIECLALVGDKLPDQLPARGGRGGRGRG